MYKVEETFDVLNGTVPDFSSGDVTLAFTVNGNKESGVAFPNKNEGFKVKDVNCDDGITAKWDDSNWALKIENSNGNSKIKCTINFKRYEENILNGSYPVLKDGLVPVTIDDSGNVTKADVTTDWYSYQNKQWANAVILADGVTEPEAGASIAEKDIESYFVWIPKYSYRLFDMGDYTSVTSVEPKEQPIEIRFGAENTTDTNESCKTPMESGGRGECDINDWMTHPAFLAFDTNGLWVGKFETGYQGANSAADANKNEVSPTKIIIKPNVYSWRNITIGNSFKTAKEYKSAYQSHLMKNTEWGVVAYLSHSVYGTCDGNSCEEVRINNSQSVLTGVSAKSIPEVGSEGYKDYAQTTPNQNNDKSNVYPESKEASTTGNNTGIFDMSGGSWEQVMGYMSTGQLEKSGITEEDLKEENSKYFDKYLNTSNTQYDKRILGDATGELGPFTLSTSGYRFNSWYKDNSWFLNSIAPWFSRGAQYTSGTTAGIFAFNCGEGIADASFRIVLAPKL